MEDKINDLFQQIKIPRVSGKDMFNCDMDTTSKEIEEVIDIEAFGTDGFPPEILLPQSLQLDTIKVLQ